MNEHVAHIFHDIPRPDIRVSTEEFRGQPARRFTDNFKLAHDGALPELVIQELFVRNPLRLPLDTVDSLLDMGQRAKVVTVCDIRRPAFSSHTMCAPQTKVSSRFLRLFG